MDDAQGLFATNGSALRAGIDARSERGRDAVDRRSTERTSECTVARSRDSMMGYADRARRAKQTRPVWWDPCVVCGDDWPWPSPKRDDDLGLRMCQRCLVADLQRVRREAFERFRLLPFVRVMNRRRPFQVIEVDGPRFVADGGCEVT